MSEEMQLGGNITLVGFKNLEPAKMVVVKKMVGNYIRKVQERGLGFENVVINMKKVHNSKFEIGCKLMVKGKPFVSNVDGFNLFVVLGQCLKKIVV